MKTRDRTGGVEDSSLTQQHAQATDAFVRTDRLYTNDARRSAVAADTPALAPELTASAPPLAGYPDCEIPQGARSRYSDRAVRGPNETLAKGR